MNELDYNEEQPLTGTHKRRFAKVTLYLEVPSLKDDENGNTYFMTESEIAKLVEDRVCTGDIIPTSFPDIITSQIEGDDFTKFNEPVGWLTPDGKFFLIESSENGLAHIALSGRIYGLYEELICKTFGTSLENRMERCGFIKVHQSTVRYYSHDLYSGYHYEGNVYTPNITPLQQERLIKYLEYILKKEKYHAFYINSRYTDFRKVKQMDNVQFNSLFHYD